MSAVTRRALLATSGAGLASLALPEGLFAEPTVAEVVPAGCTSTLFGFVDRLNSGHASVVDLLASHSWNPAIGVVQPASIFSAWVASWTVAKSYVPPRSGWALPVALSTGDDWLSLLKSGGCSPAINLSFFDSELKNHCPPPDPREQAEKMFSLLLNAVGITNSTAGYVSDVKQLTDNAIKTYGQTTSAQGNPHQRLIGSVQSVWLSSEFAKKTQGFTLDALLAMLGYWLELSKC